VAATKSFFHQVLNIIRFATEVAEQKKSAPTAIIEEIRANLTLAPKKVQEIIDQN
jgi:glucosamine 6-phosphate synthetase-like amidotransferase/phosphosugar isomerase protein